MSRDQRWWDWSRVAAHYHAFADACAWTNDFKPTKVLTSHKNIDD